MPTAPNGLDVEMVADLRRSGLSDLTIQAANMQPFHNDNIKGYSIPYYDKDGMIIPGFHRVRLVPAWPVTDEYPRGMRYYQGRKSGSHAYLPPPDIQSSNVYRDSSIPLIIVEGEKKALASIQIGHPCIALAGSSSWRSAGISFEKAEIVELSELIMQTTQKEVVFHLDDRRLSRFLKNVKVVPEFEGIEWVGRTVYIAFDTDNPTTRRHVQEEALSLACWLDEQGAVVRTINFPPNVEKVGLDDFLVNHGMSHKNPQSTTAKKAIDKLVEQATTFPVLDHLPHWISSKLRDKATTERDKAIHISLAVVADLDARGSRLIGVGADGSTERAYYYNKDIDRLMMYSTNPQEAKGFDNFAIGKLFSNRYNIQPADTQIMSRLGTFFKTKGAIQEVAFHRLMVGKYDPTNVDEPDAFYFQLSPTKMVKVTANHITQVPVGTDGVVFELISDMAVPMDWEPLQLAIEDAKENFRPDDFWKDLVNRYNIMPMYSMDRQQTYALLATHAYLSPALFRWRRLQLPNEILVCEPDSGKSSFYKVRNGIWAGKEILYSENRDIKVWKTNVASAVGIFCIDNVNSMKEEIQDEVRDIINQIVTSTTPEFRERKYYTLADEARIPIVTPFSFTAISPMQLFNRQDFLQRSIPLNLQRPKVKDTTIVYRSISRRLEWLAHQFVVMQRFFQLVKLKWDDNYQAVHRLENYEQAMILMSEVLGNRELVEPAVKQLQSSAERAFMDTSPIYVAIRSFKTDWFDKQNYEAAPEDLWNWIKMHKEYSDASELKKGLQSFTTWLSNTSSTLEQATGVKAIMDKNGRLTHLEVA